MRTPPIPAFPGVSHEPILHALEAQPAPRHPAALLNLRLPARKGLQPRVEYYYRQLQALPRRVRRALTRRYARSLAGVALLLALGQAPALAANIDVNGTTCTVANAIRSANMDTAVGGCTAGNGADTLVLAPNSTHALTMVEDATYGPTGLPLVRSQITIAGNNSTIERGAGAPEFRILAVGDTGNLSLQALTLSGGYSLYVDGVDFGRGGGVFNNNGILTVTNCTVSGNTSGDSGGGVFSFGSTTLSRNLISGNTAPNGAEVSTTPLLPTTSTSSARTAMPGFRASPPARPTSSRWPG